MADTDLKVIVKAKELTFHSFNLTSNCDRYPKKYRHSLSDKIQIKCLDIQDALLEANRINNVTNKQLRCETITKAITYCDQLLNYIELSMRLKLVTGKSAECWTSMVCDVKHMALAWRKSEQK